ncbi:trwN protein [Bartonella quintana]|uniref:trwN protein n=1 Tax=Bartonella quintana TaxID=803 RepID=UPI001ABA39FD|nr:trwN protein [Bartonella quintana]
MIVPSFMVLAAAYAPSIHPTIFSAQPFTFEEAFATTEKFKQSGHNFGISLGQINVKNLKWFSMSCLISCVNLFDFCKNLKAVRIVLTHCYERAVSEYNSEQTTLQTALNFYNRESFKSGLSSAYVQKIASHVAAEAPALLSEKPQQSVQFSTRKSEQTMKTEALPSSSEELEDAFTHKTSSVRDAFTTENSSLATEDSSSFEREQE